MSERQSGRTTRLIEAAIQLALEGGDVLVVVHAGPMIDYAWSIIGERVLLGRLRMRVGRMKRYGIQARPLMPVSATAQEQIIYEETPWAGSIGVGLPSDAVPAVQHRPPLHVLWDHVARGEW